MVVEAATAADAERVWELVCILEDIELDHDACQRIFAEQLASPAWCCLVAREEPGAPAVGVINMRFEEQLHHAERVAAILELVVDPAVRSGGAGHALFAAGCEAARAAGCVQIELETGSWREGAHRFYEREGMIFDHRYYTMKLS